MSDKALDDKGILYEGGVSRTGSRGWIRKEDALPWPKENSLGLEATFDQIGVELARAYVNDTLEGAGYEFVT